MESKTGCGLRWTRFGAASLLGGLFGLLGAARALLRLAVTDGRGQMEERVGGQFSGPELLQLPAGDARQGDSQALGELGLGQAQLLAEGLDPLGVDLATFGVCIHEGMIHSSGDEVKMYSSDDESSIP